LGLLGAQCEAPEGQPEAPEEEEKACSRKKPIEEKKNFCWIEGLRDSNALAIDLQKLNWNLDLDSAYIKTPWRVEYCF
jgi:hypothetical protein